MVRGLVFNHQDKARAFIQAIGTSLVEYHKQVGEFDYVLTSDDIYRLRVLKQLRQRGCKLFLVYPHDGGPNLANDVQQAWDHTTASLVAAQGHKEIMELYGYTKPIHVIGWSLCPLKPFAKTEGRKILFAPIHPRCDVVDQDANRNTFKILARLAREDKIDLTVRFIGSLEGSGLKPVRHKNIKYTEGYAEPAVFQIDHHDVVIAHLTFAYLAVARGKPVAWFGSDVKHHLLPKGKPIEYVKHWDEYHHLLKYPFDIGHVKDPLSLLQHVASGDMAYKWRKRMIGEAFDPQKFKNILGNYLEKKIPEEEADTPQGMTEHERARYVLKYGRNALDLPYRLDKR